jgi:hypothetical protein
MAFLDFLSPIFGSKPEIAQYTPVNLQADQLKALQGDIAAWPDIANLGNMFQQYMLNQYETAIPGFKDILKMGGQSVEDMFGQATDLYGKGGELFDQGQKLFDTAAPFLKGEIPQDVADQVQRSSAFQNLMSGGGGAMANANTARNYGLTSLGLINQGASLLGQGAGLFGQGGGLIGEGAGIAGNAGNAAQRWAALSGAQMPQGMLVTPEQQAQLDMQQNLIERNIKQQQFNVNAAPNPVAKGLSDLVANLTGAYLGSLGGGKMGGGGGGQTAPTAMGPAQYGTGDVSSPGYSTSISPGYSSPAFPGGTNDSYALTTGGATYSPYQSNIAPNPFSDYGSFGITSGVPQQPNPFDDYLNSMAFQQGAFGG